MGQNVEDIIENAEHKTIQASLNEINQKLDAMSIVLASIVEATNNPLIHYSNKNLIKELPDELKDQVVKRPRRGSKLTESE